MRLFPERNALPGILTGAGTAACICAVGSVLSWPYLLRFACGQILIVIGITRVLNRARSAE